MGNAFLHGFGGGSNGTELNFSVQACASESALPGTPEENTIAVITDTAVTGYLFQTEEPESGAEGSMWFRTAAESAVSFNALKENTIQVYPIYAKQYVGGSWISRDVWAYLNGTWVTWPERYLYYCGDTFADVTGGWAVGESVADASLEETYMQLSTTSSDKYRTHVATQSTIDLSAYSTICASVTVVKHSQDSTAGTTQCRLGYADSPDTSLTSVDTRTAAEVTETGDLTIRCDISGVTGSYCVIFGIGYFSVTVRVNRVWLE